MSAEIKTGDATIEVSSERLLFKLGSVYNGTYDVTSDGQKFLVAMPQINDTSMPVTLVVNWLGEIKKK